MKFSEILSYFDFQSVFMVENSILGQRGYLFQLKSAVAYLYEETRGNGEVWLYINQHIQQLDTMELNKIHSMMRLERINPRKLKTKDFWLYSKIIEDETLTFLDLHPRLVKGSTHMAFAPRNYTRFSENILFDFDFIYQDMEIVEAIKSFEGYYQSYRSQNPELYEPEEFTDDFMYRYLISLNHQKRQSINGRISLPHLLRLLFEQVSKYDDAEILVDTGPYYFQLRKNSLQMDILTRSRQFQFDDRQVRVLSFDYSSLKKLFQMN